MSDVGLLLLALGFGLTALYLHLSDSPEHRDARKRNPERTWDDER